MLCWPPGPRIGWVALVEIIKTHFGIDRICPSSRLHTSSR
jgi:hypothetical protein